MQEAKTAWEALAYGGPMVYPLLLLGIIAMVIIIDRAAIFARCLRLPKTLIDLVETYGFNWDDLDRQLKALAPVNVYGRFFNVIARNRSQPAWWVESRAGDEAGGIEKNT
jgi:biopolymer transport protein ExbB